MNQVTMEKDQDLTTLKKKLEGMVKLNQALTNERSELMNKIKDMVINNYCGMHKLIIYIVCSL